MGESLNIALDSDGLRDFVDDYIIKDFSEDEVQGNFSSDPLGAADIPFDETDITDVHPIHSPNMTSDMDGTADILYDEADITDTHPIDLTNITSNMDGTTDIPFDEANITNIHPTYSTNMTSNMALDSDGLRDLVDNYIIKDFSENEVEGNFSSDPLGAADIPFDEANITNIHPTDSTNVTSDEDDILEIISIDGFQQQTHNLSYVSSFIEHCRNTFQWTDLSGDVIMDVGCGVEGTCGKQILYHFPNVERIIGIDNNRETVNDFVKSNETRYAKMACHFADIRIRAKTARMSVQAYLGRMDKVLSTDVFGEIVEKEEAFRSVFHLLKPGGEAAISFILSEMAHDWLVEMLKIPKWAAGYCIVDRRKKGAYYYRKMVEKIGFQVIECKEYKRERAYPVIETVKEAYCEAYKKYFNIPSGSLDEFKEDCVKVLLNLNPKYGADRMFETFTELYILLTKPTDRV